MLAIITKLDGVNVQLFHVEQWDNGTWEYRVMDPAGNWLPEVKAAGEGVVVPLLHATADVRVEWRVPGGEWQAAVPHEYGPAECDFTVCVKRGGLEPLFEGLRVCSVVRGHPSGWVLEFPQRRVAVDGPEVVTVRGRSVCPGIGQVLRVAGEFQQGDGNFSIINAGPSQAALLPVAAALPGVLPFTGAFFVKAGRLSDGEIEALKQETAPWH